MLEWLENYRQYWWVVAAGAGLLVVVSLVIPVMVVRIQPDYFAHAVRPKEWWETQHVVVRMGIMIGKNVVGWVLMASGVAMLVLPGQGLLTIVMGFFLIDFPGKYQVEKWLVRRKMVLGAMNWMRRKWGKEDLVLEADAR